jgi:hypothetical protein
MALNIDADELNADWLRASVWDLPRDPEVLLFNIGADRWEHFKTLPAFKAIPEGLEAKVDALARARKASNPDLVKYDEDQPRDERGRFGSGTGGNGGNGLTPKEILDLKRDQPDTLKEQVYKAEENHRPRAARLAGSNPVKIPRDKFETDEEYSKAYKEYKENFINWARENSRDVISETGKQHLDGTQSGVQNYVNEITNSNWFVAQFGDGGLVGNPEVNLVNEKYSGKYTFGIDENGDTKSGIFLNNAVSMREPTIVHELAHYATTISVTEPHSGHGVKFAENYVFLADQILGEDYASGLKDSFVKEGVLND